MAYLTLSISLNNPKECLWCKRFRNALHCACFYCYFRIESNYRMTSIMLFPFSSRQISLELTTGLQMTLIETIKPINISPKVSINYWHFNCTVVLIILVMLKSFVWKCCSWPIFCVFKMGLDEVYSLAC